MTNEQLEIIQDCIGRAIAIVNSSTDETVKNVAADIADKLISITDVQDL